MHYVPLIIARGFHYLLFTQILHSGREYDPNLIRQWRIVINIYYVCTNTWRRTNTAAFLFAIYKRLLFVNFLFVVCVCIGSAAKQTRDCVIIDERNDWFQFSTFSITLCIRGSVFRGFDHYKTMIIL